MGKVLHSPGHLVPVPPLGIPSGQQTMSSPQGCPRAPGKCWHIMKPFTENQKSFANDFPLSQEAEAVTNRVFFDRAFFELEGHGLIKV